MTKPMEGEKRVRRRANESLDQYQVRAGLKAAPNPRHVSVKGLSELTGFDRNTIAKWMSQGCPYVSKGERGSEYVLDVRDVWKWREAKVRDEALGNRPAGGDDSDSGFSFMGVRDPGEAKKLADAMRSITELGKEQGSLVHIQSAVASYARGFALIRQAVMGIPEKLARDLSGFPKDRVAKARDDAMKSCLTALKSGAAEIERTIGHRADV